MRVIVRSMTSRLPRTLMLLLLITFTAAGCGSSSNGTTGPGTPPPTDQGLNSSYFGSYHVDMTIGEVDGTEDPCHHNFTLTIGDDEHRALEENYVYLPEDGGFTDGDGNAVTRDGQVITLTRNSTLYVHTIILTFAEDLSSATIEGSVSDDDPDNCNGVVSGTLTLVTRNPAEISDAFLQYRLFPQDQDIHVAWMELSKDGGLLALSDLEAPPVIKNSDGTKLDTTAQVFYSSEYLAGTYNSETLSVDFEAERRSCAGYLLTTASALIPSAYTLSASVKEGEAAYTVSRTLDYPGDPVDDASAPVVIDILSAERDTEMGAIDISWESPDTAQDLFITIMKQDSLLMEITIPAADDQTTSVTVPADQAQALLDLAGAIDDYDLLTARIQTRQYTEDGMNHARGYSETIPIEGTASGEHFDNSEFYGAFDIADTGLAPSLTIGNNPDSACFDDYLYLPDGTLNAEWTCDSDTYSVERNADTLTITRGEQILVLDFEHDKTFARVLTGNVDTVSEAGTASLITETPAVVQFARIIGQYNGNDDNFDGQRVRMALTVEGAPIDVPALDSLEIKNSLGESVDIIDDADSIQSLSHLTGSFDGSVVIFDESPMSWSGFSVDYQDSSSFLPLGDYQLIATLAHNGTDVYTVTCTVASPGNADDDGEEPVQTGDRNFELNPDNSMTISCPVTAPDFDAFDINIIEVEQRSLFDYSFNTILNFEIDRAAIVNGTVSMTIPSQTVLDFYDSEKPYVLELETKKNTATGTVIHRSYMYGELVTPEPEAAE